MKRVILLLSLASMLLSAGAQAAYENPSVIGQVPDRVVITIASGVQVSLDKSGPVPHTGVASLDALADKYQITGIEPLYADMAPMFKNPATREKLVRFYAVDFPASKGLDRVLADYAAVREVEEARAVDICKMYDAFLPNDIQDAQWYLRNINLGGKDIRALGGWAASRGDSNVVVAICDSGVDWHHPDLGGPGPNYARGSVWINWPEYNGITGVDDDHNGKMDDIRGWDFVNVPGDGWPGEDVATADNDPSDFESHGTMCAGCAAPMANNNVGIAATAPGCKVMAVRVGWLPAGETQGVVRMDFAASGMIYAAGKGAKIINCSWGSSSYLATAVQVVLDAGLLVVTAAGNDNNETPSYLGGYGDPRVMAVAATNSDDGKADFSSFGPWVDLSAPGVSIYSTYYNSADNTHGYASWQGTSFSSPITAGSAALLWSAHPTYDAFEIAQLLTSTCDNIDAQNPGLEGKLGAGRVNLLRALGNNVQEIPGEFTLLSDALNEAAVGDTIKILASHPLTSVTLMGKSLQIMGGYAAGYVNRDPVGNPTVLSGSAVDPAVQFYGSVDNSCVVDGFRIQGGHGRFFANIPYAGTYGGGIMLNQTSPTLRNLQITGNSVGDAGQLGLGGGIALYNSQAVLENVAITGNTGIYGSGVFVYQGSPTFANCQITDNVVFTGNGGYPPRGGGLMVLDGTATLTDCTISGHHDTDLGGGIYAGTNAGASNVVMTGGTVANNSAKTNGAGIYKTGGALTLDGVTVSGNTKLGTSTFMGGGGIFATGATVQLTGATILDNDAHLGGGVYLINCANASFAGTLVAGNNAAYWGGALLLENSAGLQLHNLTVADNTATAGAAGIYINGGSATIGNNISAFNTGGAAFGNGIHIQTATTTISCNDVFGNTPANYGGITDPTGTNGNISADPLFCDHPTGDYRIAATSPAAPPQSGACGVMGSEAPSCVSTPVDDPEVIIPVKFQVDRNYPNPFNPSTTIRFALPTAAHTTVTIYDVSGRLVKTLLDENLTAAQHSLRWLGDNNQGRPAAAGVYFYRVQSGTNDFVGRMALVK